MAQFEEASPICRGKNLSWETVLLFFNNMPREAMPKAKFNSYVEARINAWTQTHSQIARQLAFYYEENGVCYPRFTEKTSLQDLFLYMQNWAVKYFIPNPYAPSLKGKVPTCIYSYIVSSINNGQKDFDEILDSIFQVKLSSHDKVNVYLSNFTNLFIDNKHQVSINEKLGFIGSELYPAEEYATDTKKYYDYFTLPTNDIFDSNRRISISMSLQQIFYGAPGTGKSHKIKNNEDVKKADEKNLVIRTTFHPDSDYSTFVGAYKPTMKLVADKYKAVAGKDEEITYEFIPQAFLQAYVAAWNNPDENVFLIIEEINRGNCAQIFGDLFQLLDRDGNGFSEYPINADRDIAKYLCGKDENGNEILVNKDGIKDGKLKLPNNLYIWATMNTSDQSLFPIDSAFKRRWNWEYIKIKNHPEENYKIVIEDEEIDWYTFIQKINEIIASMTSSADKQLGYFFCKANSEGKIDAKTFVGKVIFYLWNDVFKDYGLEDASLFRYTDKEGTERDLTFPDFYDEDGNNVNVVRLRGFIESVMNWQKQNEENN